MIHCQDPYEEDEIALCGAKPARYDDPAKNTYVVGGFMFYKTQKATDSSHYCQDCMDHPDYAIVLLSSVGRRARTRPARTVKVPKPKKPPRKIL